MICRDIGPPDAKIVLVGEAPGAVEEKTGIPFSGSSGSLLKHMLSHAGISFASCFVTNVMNVRPPNNKFKYFYDGKMPSESLETSITKLRNKLESVRPDVIIPLGNEALKAVCNKSGINAYRGTWLSFRDIPVLPTFHPAYVMRQYQSHVIVEMDFVKAVSRKQKDLPKMILKPSLQQVVGWIDECITNSTRVSYDIETVDRHVRCIAFCNDTNLPICIPFIRFKSSDLIGIGDRRIMLSSNDGFGSYWSVNDEIRVLDAIQRLFDSGLEIVGQNAICFDAPVLKREFGIHVKEHHLDTMHAFHCLYSELPMNLSFICSILTDYPNYWTEKVTTDDISEWTYNIMDAVVTLEISYEIERSLQEEEFEHVCRLG